MGNVENAVARRGRGAARADDASGSRVDAGRVEVLPASAATPFRLLSRGVARACVTAALFGALVVSGCGGGGGKPSSSGDPSSTAKTSAGGGGARTDATLRIGVQSAPVNLNPAKDNANSFSMVRWLSNDSIVRARGDGTYGPGLATTFAYVGSGNTRFRFTLRHDARFSDGSPVTAAAVKAWLDYFKKTAGPTSSQIPLESVKTQGRWTVELTLSRPMANLPRLLSGLYNWGLVSSLKDPASLSRRTDGAGPYVLEPSETVPGNTYTYVPNKEFYDTKQIKWGKVVVKVIANSSTMLQALQSGQLDVAQGDVATAKAAESAGLTVKAAPPQVFLEFTFLDRQGELLKPLADVRVRQALNYAVDRKPITEALVGKFGTPTSVGFAVTPAASDLKDPYPYDPDKAKRLLAEAGYPNGFTLPVVAQGAFAGQIPDAMTHAVADQLSRVGINLKITTAATTAEFLQKALGGSVPVFQNNWPVDDVLAVVRGVFDPDGGVNPLKQGEPTIDRLAAAVDSAPPDEVATKTDDLVRRIVTQAYFLPVFAYPVQSGILFATDRVGGVSTNRYSAATPLVLQWFPQ
jgi:peptide/nickel transport system substrate-binding protein